jgi:pyruvate kinase
MANLVTRRVHRETLTSITASIRPEMSHKSLAAMVESGVTIFRINFSWFAKAPKESWISTIKMIQKIAKSHKLVLGIMLDTKGPEFRVQRLADGAAAIEGTQKTGYVYKTGSKIRLTLNQAAHTDEHTIAVQAPAGTTFGELSGDRRVVFCDGDYEARIASYHQGEDSMMITPTAQLPVWDLAKVNFPGTAVTARALSQEDMDTITFFIKRAGKGLDKRVRWMFAQSFVKSVEDLERLKHFLQDNFKGQFKVDHPNDPIIIAKLETFESVQPGRLEKIIDESSAVMIARGDLANESSRQEVPQIQRQIVRVAKQANKPVLLATQVYASMADKRIMNCTRPEAEDVRSALELGIDGFVLTGETTNRPDDPEEVVKALANQLRKDEKDLIDSNHYEDLREPIRKKFHEEMKERMKDPNLKVEDQRWYGTRDFAIAAVFRGNAYRAIGLFPFTMGGGTVREMSRFYPETEIYALTPSPETAQLSLLYRCTHPVLIEIGAKELEGFNLDSLKDLVRDVVAELNLRERAVAGLIPREGKPPAKYAIGTMAHPPLQLGGTDTLARVRIDDLPSRSKRMVQKPK